MTVEGYNLKFSGILQFLIPSFLSAFSGLACSLSYRCLKESWHQLNSLASLVSLGEGGACHCRDKLGYQICLNSEIRWFCSKFESVWNLQLHCEERTSRKLLAVTKANIKLAIDSHYSTEGIGPASIVAILVCSLSKDIFSVSLILQSFYDKLQLVKLSFKIRNIV